MVLCTLIRRNYGGKGLMSATYHSFDFIKEGMVLLFCSTFQTRLISNFFNLALLQFH